jgi:putative FmdB family regulatory protein
MPIYEYRCGACGRAFERLVQGAQAVLCPTCNSADVSRLLSLFGFKSGQGFVASAGGGGCGCGRGGCGCH